MALIMATWDLPADKEQLERYAAWVEESIKETLRLPGLQEWRRFRNPSGMTPQVMAIHDFDTMASLQRWLQSADYAATLPIPIHPACP